MMAEDIRDILDECLDRVLSGQESIEECLERCPDFRDELEPLLSLAIDGSEALAVEVPRTVKATGKERLMASAAEQKKRESGKERRFALPRFILRPVLIGTALVLLLFGGTALAASSAQPDNFLYPVKRAMEDVRTVIAIQNLDQAHVNTGHADARLDELENMVGKGKPRYVPNLLGDFDEDITSAIDEADAAEIEGEDTAEVRSLIAEAQSRHDRIVLSIRDEIPDDVQAEIEDDIEEAAEREEVQALEDGREWESGGAEGAESGEGEDHEGPAGGEQWREDSESEYHESQPPKTEHRDDTSNEGTGAGGDGEHVDSGSGQDVPQEEDGNHDEGAHAEGRPSPDSGDNPSSN